MTTAAAATQFTYVDSPVGRLLVAGAGGVLRLIGFPAGKGSREPGPEWDHAPTAFAEAARQLRAYFEGRLRRFDLPLALDGTPFQRRVWTALVGIPYGHTASYGELAAAIGAPRAVRAVGHANGQNPLPIVVPCHRVIGSNGSLTGYGGGVSVKRFLLDLERQGGGLF